MTREVAHEQTELVRLSHPDSFLAETGRVVLSGTGHELLGNDHVRKAFLGI